MAEDDVTITIPDDEDADPKGAVVKTADEGVADLKRQLADATARASTLEQGLRRQTVERAIDGELATAKAEAETARKAYREAFNDGDTDKVTEANAKLVEATAHVVRLEGMKGADPGGSAERVPSGDPTEDYINGFSSRSQSWLRSHRDYVTDKKNNQRLVAAHYVALSDGHVADSDAYFAAIETQLGLREGAAAAAGGRDASREPAREGAREEPARRAAPIAAPPSRSVPGTPLGPREVRLSREELDIAETLGMKPVDYARNKLALEREGRIGPNARNQ